MSGGEWNLTDELAYALAHALAHNHHAKGTCEQCDRGRAAVDEWLRLREDTRRGWSPPNNLTVEQLEERIAARREARIARRIARHKRRQ